MSTELNIYPIKVSDKLREKAKKFGISHLTVGMNDIKRLHRLLSFRVLESDLFDGTYVVEPLRKKDIDMRPEKECIEIHVSAHYFTRREAVTFNRDGFIGFCGWASSGNAEPIYRAFDDWMNEIIESRKAGD